MTTPPAPINNAVLITAVSYALYYSNTQLPLVSAPWTVTNCRLRARKTTCGWEIRVVADHETIMTARGTVTLNHGRARIALYDTTARRHG